MLYTIGDLHLSLGTDKPMDIFPGWNDYVERLEKNWRKLIKPEDTMLKRSKPTGTARSPMKIRSSCWATTLGR